MNVIFLSVCFLCFLYVGNLSAVPSEKASESSLKSQVELIVSGDGEFLRYIKFDDYLALIAFSVQLKYDKQSGDHFQGSDSNSQFLIFKSFVSGLENMDPRIRISCSKVLLKQLSVLKNASHDLYAQLLFALQPRVHQALASETSVAQSYLSRGFDGEAISGVPVEYLRSLDLSLTRALILLKLEKGHLQVEDFVSIDPWFYKALVTVIADEDEENVPIYSLSNRFEILVSSLKNPSKYVSHSAAEFLSRIYAVDPVRRTNILTLAQKYPILRRKLPE